MKKLTAYAAAALMSATAAAGVLAVPTAANAQVTIRLGDPGFWTPQRVSSIREQIWRLDRQIDRAAQRGTISRREAFQLNRQVRFLRNQYNTSARNGLTFSEVRYLQDRVNRIRVRLRMDRLDWDRQDFWTTDRWRSVDRDWDGVPNRYDRDRDGDGVPNAVDPRPNRRY
jgi:hypothetical protein